MVSDVTAKEAVSELCTNRTAIGILYILPISRGKLNVHDSTKFKKGGPGAPANLVHPEDDYIFHVAESLQRERYRVGCPGIYLLPCASHCTISTATERDGHEQLSNR